jgi:hypothetical protein
MILQTELGEYLQTMDAISTGQAYIPGAEPDEETRAFGRVADTLTTDSFREACGLNNGIIWVSPFDKNRGKVTVEPDSNENQMPASSDTTDTSPLAAYLSSEDSTDLHMGGESGREADHGSTPASGLPSVTTSARERERSPSSSRSLEHVSRSSLGPDEGKKCSQACSLQ